MEPTFDFAVRVAVIGGGAQEPRKLAGSSSGVGDARIHAGAGTCSDMHKRPQLSGRPGALLRPAPLRTGRARFRASGSSKPGWLVGGQQRQTPGSRGSW